MRPLVDVLVDAGCQVVSSELRRAFRAAQVDVARDVSPMAERGGILLLGARTADGASSLGALRRLRATHPELVVYLCDKLDGALAQQLVRYARAGLDRFFALESPEDEAVFAECMRMRWLAPPPAALRALTTAGLKSRPLCLAAFAIRAGHASVSMNAASRFFGVSGRRLEGWCLAAGLPAPAMLFRCGRFLHHAELVRRGVADASERAARLGFETATELRQFLWRFRRSASGSKQGRLVGAIPELSTLLETDAGW